MMNESMTEPVQKPMTVNRLEYLEDRLLVQAELCHDAQEACREIRRLRDHKCAGRHEAMLLEDNQRLRELLKESNAVCACVSSPAEGHECVPTSKAVLSMLRKLREDLEDEQTASDLHAALNRRTAKALGKPVTGEGSTWHDIPEQIEALRETIKGHEAAIQGVLACCGKHGLCPTCEDEARARLKKP